MRESTQAGVKKSWKGTKGPGCDKVAVTFARLISRDPDLPPSPSSPLALARAPGAVGPLRWLPATSPSDVSASPHTSPVCRYPSAVSRPLLSIPVPPGRRCPFVPICAAPSTGGLLASAEVTWGTAVALSRGHAAQCRRGHSMQRAGRPDLPLSAHFTPSCRVSFSFVGAAGLPQVSAPSRPSHCTQ